MTKKAKNPFQRSLFEEEEDSHLLSSSKTSSTFADNLSLPIHRWFRYSAGFSALWARETIRTAIAEQKSEVRILDPFAGSGTVLVEADRAQVPSFGVESHPFVARLARAKTANTTNADKFKAYTTEILARAEKNKPNLESHSVLTRKCFPDEILANLDQLRSAWRQVENTTEKELGWLALASILRQCSPVGTANWQYVLPKKTKAKTSNPFEAFKTKAKQICFDLAERPVGAHKSSLIRGDARSMLEVPDEWATLVITSPPYPNNFDYADATRLEMTFFGEIEGWGCLQDAVRKYLVRSCTQHISPIVSTTSEIVRSPELDPIRKEIEAVIDALEKARHEHGGKKNYHTMIAAYFLDMAKVWKDLRRVTSPHARVCFVVGDSAPYSVYVPVDVWMGRLAVASGFRSFSFLKTRDRNIKWKNRKHRVPLHEGQLWVKG
ncbi:MAG: hypothetical protein K2X38_08935 [Gemmataceae bacterium]|nr:hypothetical protein [Gemmataceae bacterium]